MQFFFTLGGQKTGLLRRSAREPDVLILHMRTFYRGGNCVDLPQFARRLLLVLAARAGVIVTYEDLIDALYFDDDGGGSLNPHNVICSAMVLLRQVGCALGFKIENWPRVGFRLIDVLERPGIVGKSSVSTARLRSGAATAEGAPP
jgi:DNA-binding winged helix-turn-helix (wHTH) protein